MGEGAMIKKKVVTFVMLAALLALVLPAFSAGGWAFSSHSVEANGTYTGLGNVKKTGAEGDLFVSPVDNSGVVLGVLFCANHGGNIAPGVNPVGAVPFSGTQTITSNMIDHNGRAPGHITALANLSGMSCSKANSNWGNNWTPVDFVPIAFIGTVSAFAADGSVLYQVKYNCTLPDPFTLQYQEQRQYSCSKIS
jgi:hypothetical protein